MSMHKQEFPLFEQASESLRSLLKKLLINVNMDETGKRLAPVQIHKQELEEVAINGQDAVSTGVSPFFLTHSYHMEVLNLLETTQFTPDPRSPIQIADNIVMKLRDARDWAEASMATAKQDQEDQTNVHRDPAEHYKIGDLVWLNLKNIQTTHPSRTLDYRHARYKVIEVLGSHNYRLDTSPGIHDVFHTSLLRRAATDPFPSQLTSDWQPPGIIGEDNELEWEIEDILDERPRGRGRQYLVKWGSTDLDSEFRII
ncbi:uncharacterized protein BDCG_17271 [Blastomyces dermatitidis ER-3]|uniref:Tf2-1-like SH3-like domain-containing protein n=1 Tax=Ajellomyces dermatitidis (strain ER-3 / ATCC MYA-2586) TaxID=559297 RepID=A0ABX2VXN0_AJEDR|nr:uncharacterized protein BDCG_17271 [Blastomyces dermatitidis ER-3]OAT01896.1 hypothetical protein BDCG_17271 [Blastomyces dermatitidis ER-3]